jgi:hypothetical protein
VNSRESTNFKEEFSKSSNKFFKNQIKKKFSFNKKLNKIFNNSKTNQKFKSKSFNENSIKLKNEKILFYFLLFIMML